MKYQFKYLGKPIDVIECSSKQYAKKRFFDFSNFEIVEVKQG